MWKIDILVNLPTDSLYRTYMASKVDAFSADFVLLLRAS